MELHDYIYKKEEKVNELINSSFLKNQYGQIFSRKMGGQFEATYNESTIWGYALFLSSASVKVLKNKQSDVCIQGLKVAAELFETLSLMSEEYDRDYAKVLSALCYDVAGYQANAFCMLKSLNYEIEENVSLDNSLNQLFSLVTLLMKRQLQAVVSLTSELSKNSEKEEIESYWKKAINGFSQYQLAGNKSEYQEEIAEAIEYALDLREATLTSILSLLELKFIISSQRTTWTVLSDFVDSAPDVWTPYLMLLASNPYSNNKLLPPEKRVSQVELWQSQINAIRQGVLADNRGFIIQMPTSAGKTLIAELAILQQIGKKKKCLYIAPFRSLVNEIENSLSSHLSQLGYLVSSLSGSFEFDELDQFWLKESDVLVATPEKVDFLLRVKPELFTDVSLIVIDEGHVLGNLDSRSAQFELLLTRLKRWFIPKGCRFLFISAVMPDSDSDDFAKWLIADEQAKIQSPKQHDGNTWQPTRRLIGSFEWHGGNGQVDFKNHVQNTEKKYENIFIPNFINRLRWEVTRGKKIKKVKEYYFPDLGNKSETVAFLAYRYLKEGSVLVYCATVGRAGGGGVYSVLKAFLKLIKTLDNFFGEDSQFPKIDDSESLEAAIRWYGENHIITQCIRRGVAPHFGDLADEVRNAVEREYGQKKLKILVATHTLGQGVNLPIKTLLVYSLDINPNPSERVSVKVRDFWNIVGRAGRAGRETEGQVVFIINSIRDRLLFNKYSNPLNSEHVRSIFTVAMELHRAGRISEDTLNEIITEIAEPALMNFLVEEVIDTPDQQLMESFIGDTLFKIQSVEEDTKYMRGILLDNAKHFWDIEPRERKVVFARTGLSLSSCLAIEETLRSEEVDLIDVFINGDEKVFLGIALKCLLKCKEMKPKDALKNIYINENSELETFILSWINGVDLDQLRELWTGAVGETNEDLMNVYIEDCLTYRYPWGITSVIFIASLILNNDWNNFNPTIISFPSKIKNGLADQQALWLRGIGVKSRESCKLLSNGYTGLSEIRAFTNWFLNLTLDEIIDIGVTSKYSLRNIFEVISKLTLKNSINQSRSVQTFTVKGILYEQGRIEVAKKLRVGDILNLKRQPDNEYDPFAVQVLADGRQLGFVPRDLAKYISFQMDIMGKNIECKVERKFGTRIQAAFQI
ncbi:DEAD/DEAH box helicase [Metabacillus fastidiosus]|uniref:DEAD/DEAH box helicase n=1 Tax=Metabacillus fastidiosus TaxID=1458 RepID=UPI003D2B81C3